MRSLTLILFLFLILDVSLTKILGLSENKIRVSHEVFHHHFKPNKNFLSNNGKYGKHSIITNSLGFRDFSKRDIKLDDKNRLILIGDSMTEGLLLDYDFTFAGLVSKYFTKQKIDVLNAGVMSYSPIIYYHKIKYYLDKGLQFSHLVVFIDISDIEDESEFYELDASGKAIIYQKDILESNKTLKKKIRKLLKNNFYITFATFKFLDDQIVERIWGAAGKVITSEKEFIDHIASENYPRGSWTINKKIYNERKEGVERSLKYMNLLNELLIKNNIKLTIAVYPWFTQVYHYDYDSIQVKIWEEFANDNNIDFLNLFPIFVSERPNQDDDIYQEIKENYIPYDVHFNKNGNKKIADFFIKNFKF